VQATEVVRRPAEVRDAHGRRQGHGHPTQGRSPDPPPRAVRRLRAFRCLNRGSRAVRSPQHVSRLKVESGQPPRWEVGRRPTWNGLICASPFRGESSAVPRRDRPGGLIRTQPGPVRPRRPVRAFTAPYTPNWWSLSRTTRE
jgi:hypothetical protein